MENKLLIFSSKIKEIPYLSEILGFELLTKYNKTDKIDAVADWGLRLNSNKSRQYAEQLKIPFVTLESGFLCSFGLASDGYPPLSIILDDLGIYYDYSKPSRLEKLITTDKDNKLNLLYDSAIKVQNFIVQHELSKYNQSLNYQLVDRVAINQHGKAVTVQKIILVVDQPYADLSVKYGGAEVQTFEIMLRQAIAENPTALILVKIHPDVIMGNKKGNLVLTNLPKNVKILATDVSVINLLKQVDKVYVVTSQLGFEALLVNKEVVTFGVPWYAGWGLTDDRHPAVVDLQTTGRRYPRQLWQLIAAAYLLYTRYLNPHTKKQGTFFDVANHIMAFKYRNQLLTGYWYIVGMSYWQKAILKPFLQLPSCEYEFINLNQVSSLITGANNKNFIFWGRKDINLTSQLKTQGHQVVIVEDGFIRSVGIGSNGIPPISLVFDDMGIYFDAVTSSRLEHLLQYYRCTNDEIQLGQKLIDTLLLENISKYNVGKNTALKINSAMSKKIILVPGQIEKNASIKFSLSLVKTNLQLLQKVRSENPNAYIIYKPHPDVLSGNYRDTAPISKIMEFANQIVTDINIINCLNVVDEVHTITSLTGFEALLRQKKVVCYGIPFYAGWGLTEDKIFCKRRTQHISLPALAYITLYLYAWYIDPITYEHTDIFTGIKYIQRQKKHTSSTKIKQNFCGKQLIKLKYLLASIYKM